MHGPAAPRDELQRYFCPKEEGGLLNAKGVVDFTVAKGVAPGVFETPMAQVMPDKIRASLIDQLAAIGLRFVLAQPGRPLCERGASLCGESRFPLPLVGGRRGGGRVALVDVDGIDARIGRMSLDQQLAQLISLRL